MLTDKIENVAKMKESDLRAAARAAMNASRGDIRPVRPSGCGRAYVFLGYKAMRKNAKAVRILREEGFKVTMRPYHSGMHIYVGYDNCTGVELARAEVIAKTFRDHGIASGADADGD